MDSRYGDTYLDRTWRLCRSVTSHFCSTPSKRLFRALHLRWSRDGWCRAGGPSNGVPALLGVLFANRRPGRLSCPREWLLSGPPASRWWHHVAGYGLLRRSRYDPLGFLAERGGQIVVYGDYMLALTVVDRGWSLLLQPLMSAPLLLRQFGIRLRLACPRCGRCRQPRSQL